MGIVRVAARVRLPFGARQVLSGSREMVRKAGQAYLLFVVGSGRAPADGGRGPRTDGALPEVWRDTVLVLVFAAVSRTG